MDMISKTETAEYFELLRFPSVATDKSRFADCAACADWLKRWLGGLGATAEFLLPQDLTAEEKSSHLLTMPVVYGEIKGRPGAPTVLIYGHYDVQPPDPLEAWKTPPFEPVELGGSVYARGAQDDKGQAFALLCGVREFLAENDPGSVTIKVVIEGQEESGSSTLFRLMREPAFRARIAADVMLVSDTYAAPDLQPAITMGLRGINLFSVTLTAANRDLHSGQYGNLAPNAIQGLVQLLATLHRPDGSIAVEGYTDGIVPPTPEELAAAEKDAGAAADLEADIGTELAGGVRTQSLAQRAGFEPTLDFNGLHAGYGGPGVKTVIPCRAEVKISTRLAPGQDPRKSYEAIKRHLLAHCPRGMRVEVGEPFGLAPGFRLPLDADYLKLARKVLTEMDPRGPQLHWVGGSIPVVSGMSDAAGAGLLVVGWGQSDDCIHSPNEHFSWRQFEKAKEWAKRMLTAIKK